MFKVNVAKEMKYPRQKQWAVVCKVCGWHNVEDKPEGEINCRLCDSTLQWHEVAFWCWLKQKLGGKGGG